MATYNVKVTVEYEFEVDVDSEAEAERHGWNYEDWAHCATVDSIEVEEITPEEDGDE